MDKNIRFITLSLALAVFVTNLAACSSDQIHREDSFNASSGGYAEGEDLDFDIDNVQTEAAKDLKSSNGDDSLTADLDPLPTAPTKKAATPKATSSAKKKKTSL